jgi:hypothetical protein
VLDPLATTDDLAERMQRTLSDDELTRAFYLLADASATIRAYCRRDFTTTESTERVRVKNGRLRLPNGPVTAVDSIADMNGNDVTFTWYAGNVIDFTVSPLNEWEIVPLSTPLKYVDVTYTHGYAEIPEVVVKIVCRIAATALDSPAEDAGSQSESIAGYSYTRGAIAAAGGLFAEEKAELDAYRVVGGSSRLAS